MPFLPLLPTIVLTLLGLYGVQAFHRHKPATRGVWIAIGLTLVAMVGGGGLIYLLSRFDAVERWFHAIPQGEAGQIAFLAAALPEELLKAAVLLIAYWLTRRQTLSARDFLRHAVAVALVFGAVESIGYVWVHHLNKSLLSYEGLIRCVAQLGHVAYGLIVGYGLARAVATKERRWFFGALAAAILLHGLWDYGPCMLMFRGATAPQSGLAAVLFFDAIQFSYSAVFLVFDRIEPKAKPQPFVRPRGLKAYLWINVLLTAIYFVHGVFEFKNLPTFFAELISYVLTGAMVWGLWQGQQWARRTVLTASVIVLPFAFALTSLSPFMQGMLVASLLSSVFTFVYFFLPEVRRFYAREDAATPPLPLA